MKPASNVPCAMRPASPPPAALPSSVSASAGTGETPATPLRTSPARQAAGPAAIDPAGRVVATPYGQDTVPARAMAALAPRIVLPGRPLDLQATTEHGLSPLRNRRPGTLEHLMEVQYRDAPGQSLRGQLQYAWVLPPDCPPGLLATLEIDGKTLTLSSTPATSRGGRRSGGQVAAPRPSAASNKAFADQLIAQGFEPIPLTSPFPRRRGAQAEPVYGFLKLSVDEGEIDPEEGEPRTGRMRLPLTVSAEGTGAAVPEEPRPRPHSARTRQREQKRRAGGTAGTKAPSDGEGAGELSQASHDLKSTHTITLPIVGLPASAGPDSAAGKVRATGTERPALALEPGALGAEPGGDGPRCQFTTSVVTPPDFPAGVVIRLTVGGQTLEITTGLEGVLLAQGDGSVESHGDGLVLDEAGIAELKAAGFTPLEVQVPEQGGVVSKGGRTRTYTIYIRHQAREAQEGQADAGHPGTVSRPAESRRQLAAKARKRAAQRRAKLAEKQPQPGMATAAPASSAPSSASSSSASSSSAPADSPDQADPGSTPG